MLATHVRVAACAGLLSTGLLIASSGGAVALADCVPFLPDDAVAIAVVDPGVGSERRAFSDLTQVRAVLAKRSAA